MTLDFLRLTSGDNKPGKCTRDTKREKRLERNRESARKCRRKRKAYVGDLQEKCQGLVEENAMLQLENDRLHAIIQQLQNGTGTMPESALKRAKSEFGVSMANDLSESAVHANQHLRLEIFSQLAILTTLLLLSATLIVTTSSLVPFLATRSSGVLPPALVQVARPSGPMALPCDQRASPRKSSSVI